MSVFISHRKTDTTIALSIADILKTHHIETYVDVLDPSLDDKRHLTDKILNGLRKCSHLIAIISDNTQGSWWVPFEIGVATEGDKRIVTYRAILIPDFPDYLTMWPIITQKAQIGLFAMRYIKDSIVLEKASKTYEAKITEVKTAEDFHRLLKGDLGQS